jgi:hypothetical protein
MFNVPIIFIFGRVHIILPDYQNIFILSIMPFIQKTIFVNKEVDISLLVLPIIEMYNQKNSSMTLI